MGRKGKKRPGGHGGGKAKTHGGAPRDKKKVDNQLEGPVVVRKKGGPVLPVPVGRDACDRQNLVCGDSYQSICTGVVQFGEHMFLQRRDAVYRSVSLLQSSSRSSC